MKKRKNLVDFLNSLDVETMQLKAVLIIYYI